MYIGIYNNLEIHFLQQSGINLIGVYAVLSL